MWPQKRSCRGRTSPIPYLFTKGGGPPPPPPPPLSLIKEEGGGRGGCPPRCELDTSGRTIDFFHTNTIDFSEMLVCSNSQIQTKGWFDVSGLSHSLAFTNPNKLNLLISFLLCYDRSGVTFLQAWCDPQPLRLLVFSAPQGSTPTKPLPQKDIHQLHTCNQYPHYTYAHTKIIKEQPGQSTTITV